MVSSSGTISPCSSRSARTRNASALAFATASSRVPPYVRTPGKSTTSPIQRPSSSSSTSTVKSLMLSSYNDFSGRLNPGCASASYRPCVAEDNGTRAQPAALACPVASTTTIVRLREAFLACRPNGSDAKLHGHGPRAEVRAARGALHVRRANARRVTPRGFDVSSRLGRRAEAGPCQLLRRVGRQSTPLEPVGPITRLFVFCFDSGYDNSVALYKVD